MENNNFQDSQNPYSNNSVEESSGLDIRVLWSIFLGYKYWFMASVALCLLVAGIYLRYSTPKYEISTKVLIKDKENRRYMSNPMSTTFSEMGLMNNSNGFDNELEIISTKTLNKRAVKHLKSYVKYISDGRVKDREVYSKDCPYLIDMDESIIDTLSTVVMVRFVEGDKGLEALVQAGDFETTKLIKAFPSYISTPYGRVSINRNELLTEFTLEKPINAYICPIDPIAQGYANAISVEATSKTTTVAQLTMKDNLPERSADYLKQLVEEYNEDANIDNNIEATRTKDFVEERLGEITKELNMTEAEIAQFKQSSGIVDYKTDASINASQNIQYEQKVVEASTQLSLINDLIDFANRRENYLQTIPSNVGLSDPALAQSISKYNEIVIERNRLLRSASETSPAVEAITSEAESYFSAVRSSLQSAQRQYTKIRNDLQAQQNKYTARISSSPTNERAIVDMGRQQEVKAELYIMLLQKREENLITLNSSAYKAKVIEEPIVAGPVSPKRKIILLAALLLGLALPYIYIYLREFFSYRIEDKEDLAKACTVPFFGSVPKVKALEGGSRTIVLEENKNSLMMEVYRSLRSNLPFVLKPNENVILFTSTSSSEGKTVTAANLATSIAFVGKKVLLVGLDIRKPRLAGLFNLEDTEKGISNFLTREADDYKYLDTLIKKTTISDKLDILPAGAIPPNPAELLERENLASAINYLKSKYDYVILDTAPVGLVSDTFSIAKNADLTLYVVRAKFTLKSDIDLINALNADKRLPNMNILLNGVETQGSGYGYKHYGHYGYGKGYGYGYGYGYGNGYGYGYGYGEKGGKKLEEV